MAKNKEKIDRRTRRAKSKTKNSSAVLTGDTSFFSDRLAGSFSISGNTISFPLGSSQNTLTTLPLIEGTMFVSKYPTLPRFHELVMDRILGVECTVVARRNADTTTESVNQYAFYSEEDRTKFEAWVIDYHSRYGDAHKSKMLPPPIDGYYPYSLECRDTSTERLLEQWVWVLTNGAGEARMLGGFWFFQDESDYTFFRVTFS